MKLQLTTTLAKADILVLGVFEDDKSTLKSYHKDLITTLDTLKKDQIFTGEFGQVHTTSVKELPFYHVVLLGMGKQTDFTTDRLRRLCGKAVSATKAKQRVTLTTNLAFLANHTSRAGAEMFGRAAAEGLVLANYTFSKYLAKQRAQKKKPVTLVNLYWTGSKDAFGKGLKAGKIIAESSNMVRDMVNEPPKAANSIYMEKMARKVASKHDKVKIRVLNKSELERLGMGALLGVNRGSANPPKLIILEYNGASKQKPIAFVGKGITFDSGGYNLKPTRHIEDMKTDMAGAAAVLGTIKAAAELKIKKNLVGVMAVCENMVDAKAQHPGDIVKALNGKTIEIGNTDAEGRLVLADALTYTDKKYKPVIIVDLATLTGACVYALGYYTAALMGRDEELIASLKQAGMDSGDRVWPMPFFEDYQSWMDGSISDLNNIAQKGKGYEAGSVTAAVFLSKFTDNPKWAHLDIAGSANWGVKGDYLSKGPTGSGVRVLVYFLLGM